MSAVRSPALTDDEIRERNDKLGLQQLQDRCGHVGLILNVADICLVYFVVIVSVRFDSMEAELVEEAKEDKDLPEGVEQVVQTFITMVRQMMAGQEREATGQSGASLRIT